MPSLPRSYHRRPTHPTLQLIGAQPGGPQSDIFYRAFGAGAGDRGDAASHIKCDVIETPQAFVVHADAPGVDKRDISVEVDDTRSNAPLLHISYVRDPFAAVGGFRKQQQRQQLQLQQPRSPQSAEQQKEQQQLQQQQINKSPTPTQRAAQQTQHAQATQAAAQQHQQPHAEGVSPAQQVQGSKEPLAPGAASRMAQAQGSQQQQQQQQQQDQGACCGCQDPACKDCSAESCRLRPSAADGPVQFQHVEIGGGGLQHRTIRLPRANRLHLDRVECVCRDGVLTITIPRVVPGSGDFEERRPVRIS